MEEPAFKTLCVFCGSSAGHDPSYAQAAHAMGALLAQKHIHLVYGGGSVGVMGEVADAVLAHRGHVTGVIPSFLASKELLHPGVQDMRVVDTMHTRKALMNELSDGFLVLPGGLGTLEEFFEVLTWAQLGVHKKPIGLLNTNQFFSPLIEFVRHAHESGFLTELHLKLFVIAEEPETLLHLMETHIFPQIYRDSKLQPGSLKFSKDPFLG
jgi:hypothetical protein